MSFQLSHVGLGMRAKEIEKGRIPHGDVPFSVLFNQLV